MAAWQSTWVAVNGRRLQVTRTGGGGPPLVLAHGFSDDGLCWTPLARALEAEYDVVLVDACGHGRSDPPTQPFDPTDLADDLAGVIAALGLPRPVVLGHSMGAMTALLLAARHPALPRAIVLEDPPPSWMPGAVPMFTSAWRDGARAWLAGLQRQTHAALAAAEQANQPQWPPEELPLWAASKLAFSLSFLEHAREAQLDWAALLAQVTCPALLLTGDPARGALVTEPEAAALAEALPHLRHVPIAGAGHCVRRDQGAAYLAALRPALAAWAQAV